MSKHKMLNLFHALNEEAGAVVLSDVLPADFFRRELCSLFLPSGGICSTFVEAP